MFCQTLLTTEESDELAGEIMKILSKDYDGKPIDTIGHIVRTSSLSTSIKLRVTDVDILACLSLGVHNGVLRVHTINNSAYYSLNQ